MPAKRNISADGAAQAGLKTEASTTSPLFIRLEEIRFSDIPFRRLGGLTLPIAQRLTLIAGRNGIGKSTVLALISNASGLSRKGKSRNSYFDKLPQANLHEIIQLSGDRDFVEDEAKKPNIFLKYRAGSESFEKKCNVTKRSPSGFRIVPRNEPKGQRIVGPYKILADGKVPIPTIYLGMIRMLPIGEAEETLQRAKSTPHPDDAKFLDEFTKKIIHTGAHQDSPEITAQWVADTKKLSLHPPYGGYDSTGVSLGQDSLSAIATALVSFQKLKRELPNYPGGILVIDEIDAGFHPQAQVKLFHELKTQANRLSLQIVATTHSLTMLAEAHTEIHQVPDPENRRDAIVYLQGGLPVELLDVSDYQAIHDDMYLNLRKPPEQPVVKVYVEDDEAALFLGAILTPTRLKVIASRTQRRIKIISARVGCANLVGLLKADEYFKTVLIVLDADTTGVKTGGATNVLRLPTDPRVTVKQSPESIIESMCKALVSDLTAYPETRKLLKKFGHSTDHIQNSILALQSNETEAEVEVSADREFAKKWFTRRLEAIGTLKLIEGWVADNSAGVEKFLSDFEAAVVDVAGPSSAKKAKQVKHQRVPKIRLDVLQ